MLGSPVVVAAVSALFLASIVVHGLFVWDDPFRRTVALAVTLVIIVFAVAIRRTAYGPRVVIDARLSIGHEAATVAVVARGMPVPALVTWSPGGPSAGPSLHVEMPPLDVEQVKVWVHRRTADDRWEGLSAHVEMEGVAGRQKLTLDAVTGEGLTATEGGALRVTISHLDGGGEFGRR